MPDLKGFPRTQHSFHNLFIKFLAKRLAHSRYSVIDNGYQSFKKEKRTSLKKKDYNLQKVVFDSVKKTSNRLGQGEKTS